jgi:hypothetical protein
MEQRKAKQNAADGLSEHAFGHAQKTIPNKVAYWLKSIL